MSDNSIIVSVIIPSYGHPDYLVKSINSVISQTFKDWELIVVDDNDPETEARLETEKVMETVMRNDSRIKYIKHEKNKNGAVARNSGFAEAKGVYISLLDSDDEYISTRLSKCVEAIKNEPEKIAGVYTGCEFRRHGSVFYKSIDITSGNFLRETLACTFRFFTGSNIFVRKSVVDELKGFDPNFLRHQDYEFLARLFVKYNLKAIPEILVVKNNENFNVPNFRKIISIKEQYLAKFNSIIEQLPDSDKNYIFQRQYVAIAEDASRAFNLLEAYRYYKLAQKYGSLSAKDWRRRILIPIASVFHAI